MQYSTSHGQGQPISGKSVEASQAIGRALAAGVPVLVLPDNDAGGAERFTRSRFPKSDPACIQNLNGGAKILQNMALPLIGQITYQDCAADDYQN